MITHDDHPVPTTPLTLVRPTFPSKLPDRSFLPWLTLSSAARLSALPPLHFPPPPHSQNPWCQTPQMPQVPRALQLSRQDTKHGYCHTFQFSSSVPGSKQHSLLSPECLQQLFIKGRLASAPTASSEQLRGLGGQGTICLRRGFVAVPLSS